jgi:hypothetical protein
LQSSCLAVKAGWILFQKVSKRKKHFAIFNSCLSGFAMLKLCESDASRFALLLIKQKWEVGSSKLINKEFYTRIETAPP